MTGYKTRTWKVIGTVCMFLAVNQWSSSVTLHAAAADNHHSLIFQHDPIAGGTNRYFNMGSSSASMPDGTLVVAWSTGVHENSAEDRILLSRSSDGGVTWNAPLTLFNYLDKHYAINPNLFFYDGQLRMTFDYRFPNPASSDAYFTSSADGGLTWSTPSKINTGKDQMYPIRRPSTLSDGRLIFPYYWRNNTDDQAHLGVLIAGTGLQTWESRGDVSIPGYHSVEPSLTREPDGTLYMYMRTDLNHIYRTISTDEGISWSDPQPLNVPDADSLSDVVRLNDGRYVVAWNNTTIDQLALNRNYLSLGVFSGPDLSHVTYMLTIDQRADGLERVNYPSLQIDGNKIFISYAKVHFIKNAPYGDIWSARYNLGDIPERTGSLVLDPRLTPVHDPIYEMSFTNANHGVAVGDWGALVITEDGGQTWTKPTSVGDVFAGETLLRGLKFSDSTHGVAFKNNSASGLVYLTNDAGLTWSQGTSFSFRPTDLEFLDCSSGIVIGTLGEIYQTSDAGVTWTSKYVCQCKGLMGLTHTTPNAVWAVGSKGTLVTSVDGGTTWQERNLGITDDLENVTFDSAGQRGIIVADHGIYFISNDSGATWAQDKLSSSECLRAAVFTDRPDKVYIISDQASLWQSEDSSLRQWHGEQTKELNAFLGASFHNNKLFISGWDGRIYSFNGFPPQNDLEITQTVSPDPLLIGSVLGYKLNVTNKAGANATGVIVTDNLPSTVNFGSVSASQGTITRAGNKVTFNVGNLLVGVTVKLGINVRPQAAGNINNTVTATGNEIDVDLANNTSVGISRVTAQPVLKSLSLNPVKTQGGCQSTTGTVTLNGLAPAGGVNVALSSDNPNILVPAFVNVPMGVSSYTFTITIPAVNSVMTANITAATSETDTFNKTLTAIQIGLGTLTISPNPATVGTTPTGTITLKCAAAPGDIVITLTSSNINVAQVPGSLTISANSTTVSFPIVLKGTGTSVVKAAAPGGSSYGVTLTVK